MPAINTRAWVPSILWMGVIFAFSSLPGKDIPYVFHFQDVVFHFLVYAVLAWLYSRALAATAATLLPWQRFLLALIFASFYGITDELHQMLVPMRTASVLDACVDAAGGFAGGIFYLWRK